MLGHQSGSILDLISIRLLGDAYCNINEKCAFGNKVFLEKINLNVLF